MFRVDRIDTIELEVLNNAPQVISIVAQGVVWGIEAKSAVLLPRIYIVQPSDGYYEFDMMTLHEKEPEKDPIQMEARFLWREVPETAKGIIICSDTNQMLKPLP